MEQYAIRHARAALARLHTDRGIVNSRLATALEAAFTSGSSEASSSVRPVINGSVANGVHKTAGATGHDVGVSARSPTHAAVENEVWPPRAVARVNSVAPGGPAADAVSVADRNKRQDRLILYRDSRRGI
jgi:26S proteasome non-ATPase regulatory subunit 9